MSYRARYFNIETFVISKVTRLSHVVKQKTLVPKFIGEVIKQCWPGKNIVLTQFFFGFEVMRPEIQRPRKFGCCLKNIEPERFFLPKNRLPDLRKFPKKLYFLSGKFYLEIWFRWKKVLIPANGRVSVRQKNLKTNYSRNRSRRELSVFIEWF